MFGKESRASTIICIFCLIAGTILLAFSFKELYDYSNKSSEYVNANAKVIKHHYKDGKATAVIIEYKVDEISYTTTSKYYDDCIKSYGSIIPIKYNPNKPEEMIYLNRSINIVAPIVSIVLLSIGLSIIIVQISETLRGFKHKLLKQNNEQTKPIPKEKEEINISDVFEKPEPIKVEPKEEPKQEIVEIPRIKPQPEPIKEEINKEPQKETNIHKDIDYKEFITEIEANDDIPSFIPNSNETHEKDNN